MLFGVSCLFSHKSHKDIHICKRTATSCRLTRIFMPVFLAWALHGPLRLVGAARIDLHRQPYWLTARSG